MKSNNNVVDFTGDIIVGLSLPTVSGFSDFVFVDEDDFVVNTIASIVLTNANIHSVTIMPQSLGDTSLDDFNLNGLTFNVEDIVDNVSFNIRASAMNNASGTYRIKYLITYKS